MRVCGVDGKFDTARALTSRLPVVPAAVPIYVRGRTSVLALDFDAKQHSAAQVDADVERVLRWLYECGGRAVTDRSTSGGRHVLVPLATDTPMRVDDIRVLMQLLNARLATFDPVPMLNAVTGCITPPGSPCREGGYRQLDGPLDDAVAAFTLRSERGVVARMVALLGGATPSRHRTAVSAVVAAITRDERIVGTGDDQRLHPQYHRRSPTPAAVEAYAATGALDTTRWSSHSEARQSVLIHAVLRGASAADVGASLTSEQWVGVKRSYDKYGSGAPAALLRDVSKALTWAATNAQEFHQLTHKNKHTGGHGVFLNDEIRRRWLAHATVWINREFLGSRQKQVLLAVVQALAYSSALAGELIEGVAVVAIGGRSLSHSAGLMSESSVWSALRVLRDTPGSPVLMVSRGAGRDADRYALTTPATKRPDSAQILRARVEPVHRAWSVLGLRGRTVYELVSNGIATNVDDVFSAAMLRPSNGYTILADLIAAGLIKRIAGCLSAGATSLDDVASAHGLQAVANDRVVRHRAERLLWQGWLENRFAPSPLDTTVDERASDWSDATPTPPLDERDSARLWAAQMADGPPPMDPVLEALDLLSHELGAVIL